MILLIDDLREIPGVDAIARTPEAARSLIMFFHWDKILFDHDLGVLDDDGYKILTWALEHGEFDNDTRIQIITANPVGREKMNAALINHGYKQPMNSFEYIKN